MTPSREHPHSSGSSLWPIGLGVGILILLAGIAKSWILAAIGLAIAIVCGAMWVRGKASSGELLATGEVEPETRPEKRLTPLEQDEHPVEPKKKVYPRAAFLAVATLGLSQVVGALATLPALGFMVLPPFLKQKQRAHDIGPLSDFPEGEWFITTFEANADQGYVSRKTAFVRNNGFLGETPSLTILSNHCAHLGCPVQASAPLEGAKVTEYEGVTRLELPSPPSGFGCPCHGGQYDTEGNRTAGPPVRSLDRYSFSIRRGNVYIGPPFSVSKVIGTGADAKIYKWAQAFPGEPTGGLESWLYPIQPPH